MAYLKPLHQLKKQPWKQVCTVHTASGLSQAPAKLLVNKRKKTKKEKREKKKN
jgi:hypothetical protein